MKITRLLFQKDEKYSFVAEITGGELFLNSSLEENKDIINVAWVSMEDTEKFDHITTPLLKMLLEKEQGLGKQ